MRQDDDMKHITNQLITINAQHRSARRDLGFIKGLIVLILILVFAIFVILAT